MLQTLNLQINTSVSQDTRLEPATLLMPALPDAAPDPLQDFSALLRLDTTAAPQFSLQVADGGELPPPGNLLPQLPPPPRASGEPTGRGQSVPAAELPPDAPQPATLVGIPVLPIMLTATPVRQPPGDVREPAGLPTEPLKAGRLPASALQPADPRSAAPSAVLAEHQTAGTFGDTTDVRPRMPLPLAAIAAGSSVVAAGNETPRSGELDRGGYPDSRASAGAELLPGRDKPLQLPPSLLEEQAAAGSRQQILEDPAPTYRTQTDTLVSISMRPGAASPATSQASGVFPGSAVNVPLDSPEWGQQFGERVLFMAANKVQSAEIRLSPAEMGPVRVQLSVDDGNTTVTFHAQHAVTREVLEQSLPRLRELFSEQGLSLGDASVNEQGVNREQNDGRSAGHSTVSDSGETESPESELLAAATAGEPGQAVSTALIDTFV